jgi:septum formation protein
VAKAGAVGADTGNDVVLGCDTLVVLDGVVLGKPDDASAARTMLARLSGSTHKVVTGFAVLGPGNAVTGITVTRVTMLPYNSSDAARYVATGEPFDKAGAYALQGDAARFVARIEGSRSNVIGLPLEALFPVLHRFGIMAR